MKNLGKSVISIRCIIIEFSKKRKNKIMILRNSKFYINNMNKNMKN